MKKTSTLFLCLLILLVSCTKSSDSKPNNATSILTSGKWQLSASEGQFVLSGITETVDVLAALPSCQLDNYFIFNADGTGTTDEGATKCNSSDPQTQVDGTWKLLNNDTQLEITDPMSGDAVTADILQLDNTTLKIKYNLDYGGVSTTTTTTYVHIN